MSALIIVVIVIVVIAAVAAAVASARRRRLQQRFGPEYDRVVDEQDSRLKAEAELSRRQRRVSELDIRPLDPATQARYAAEWGTIQERFVDAPQGAVARAQDLVVATMNERGYPIEHRDQVLATCLSSTPPCSTIAGQPLTSVRVPLPERPRPRTCVRR